MVTIFDKTIPVDLKHFWKHNIPKVPYIDHLLNFSIFLFIVYDHKDKFNVNKTNVPKLKTSKV